MATRSPLYWDGGPSSPRGPMLILVSRLRVGLLVALPRRGQLSRWAEGHSSCPEDVWSRNVYCHSHTLSTWDLRGLTLGFPGKLEAGWLPSIPGLVMLRRAPQIPLPPFRTITLTQCSGTGGPSQYQVPFHAGDVDTSCTAGSSTFLSSQVLRSFVTGGSWDKLSFTTSVPGSQRLPLHLSQLLASSLPAHGRRPTRDAFPP